MLNAEEFWRAFIEQYWQDLETERDFIIDAYGESSDWTEYMLRGDDAFLSRLANQLDLTMHTEFFCRLDAVYLDPDIPGSIDFPYRMEVLIEHENRDPKEEFWKLLMIRAPLKVCIFYDYTNEEKQESSERAHWLEETYEELKNMCNDVNSKWPETPNTQYLFIIGHREYAGAEPYWKFRIFP